MTSTTPSASLLAWYDATVDDACDVVMLTGEDGRRCRDAHDMCEDCASGWCLMDTPPGRCTYPDFRFVGGAAPSTELMEVACSVP